MKKWPLQDDGRKKRQGYSDAVVGVGWYAPEDWARVRATATDPESFEDSFVEWEACATGGLAVIRKGYPNATKVMVCANHFLAWCLFEKKVNNSSSRSEYVAHLLEERQRADDACSDIAKGARPASE